MARTNLHDDVGLRLLRLDVCSEVGLAAVNSRLDLWVKGLEAAVNTHVTKRGTAQRERRQWRKRECGARCRVTSSIVAPRSAMSRWAFQANLTSSCSV